MSRRREPLYCELCGAPITGQAYRITVEGIELIVCERCYRSYISRLSRKRDEAVFKGSSTARPQYTRTPSTIVPRQQSRAEKRPKTVLSPVTSSARKVKYRPRTVVSEKEAERYELVQDYAIRVKKARERLGLSQKELAIRVKESERTIRRIEAGTLRPTVDLAKRLERVLGIKLLEPVVEEGESYQTKSEEYLTLGDIAEIRE